MKRQQHSTAQRGISGFVITLLTLTFVDVENIARVKLSKKIFLCFFSSHSLRRYRRPPNSFVVFIFLLLMSSIRQSSFVLLFRLPFSSDVVNRACPSLDRSITALYHLPVASRRDETNIPRRVLGTGCAASLPSSSSSPRRRYGSSRNAKNLDNAKTTIRVTHFDLAPFRSVPGGTKCNSYT